MDFIYDIGVYPNVCECESVFAMYPHEPCWSQKKRKKKMLHCLRPFLRGGLKADNRAKGPRNKNVSEIQTFRGYACERACAEGAEGKTAPEEVRCLSDLERNTSFNQTMIWFFSEV